MLVLLGPTATGKSQLAVEIAKQISGEIISADSMQVYRGMDIGTAKPTLSERQNIPHHLIDILNPDQAWTVSDFVKETQRLTREIMNQGRVPMIVGGTGLYLRAWLEGFSFPLAPPNPELRTRLEKEPPATLHAQLSEVDPVAANKIHIHDKKRIVRALEVYAFTGKRMSDLQSKTPSTDFEQKLIGLNLPREALYQRINERVGQMIAKGLIEEVRGLLAKGFSKTLPSLQALGYKEVIEYLDGKWTKEQMTEELKKRTRNFARRQMTWFKRFKSVVWFESQVDMAAVLAYIGEHD